MTGAEVKRGKATVTATNSKDEELSFDADKVLVAVGRKPCTDTAGLSEAGVELDERGRIKVDDCLQTSVEDVYAIGDLIPGMMLAHKAEEEGVGVLSSLLVKLTMCHMPSFLGCLYLARTSHGRSKRSPAQRSWRRLPQRPV